MPLVNPSDVYDGSFPGGFGVGNAPQQNTGGFAQAQGIGGFGGALGRAAGQSATGLVPWGRRQFPYSYTNSQPMSPFFSQASQQPVRQASPMGMAPVSGGGSIGAPTASSAQPGASGLIGSVMGALQAQHPGFGGMFPGGQPGGQQGWYRNKDGTVSYGGNIPQGQGMWNWYAGDTSPTAEGQLHQLLGSAGNAGVFDPMGSTPLVNMLQNVYQQQAAGQNRAAVQAAQNDQLDPSSYGFASLMAQLGGQNNMANALGQARLQSAMQNQDWLRNNAGGALIGQIDNYLNSQRGLSANEKLMADQQNANKGNFGSMLGQLGGQVLGAAMPTSWGGMFGGGNRLGAGTGISSGYLQGVADSTPWPTVYPR